MEMMYILNLGMISIRARDGKTYRGAFETWAKGKPDDLIAFLRANPDTWVKVPA